MRERYVEQVRLLVRLLPAIAAEEVFALKGGSAINLFYRDMPPSTASTPAISTMSTCSMRMRG